MSISGWGGRHTFTLLGFFAFFISYVLRFNMPIAIVAMAKSSKALQNAVTISHHIIPLFPFPVRTEQEVKPAFGNEAPAKDGVCFMEEDKVPENETQPVVVVSNT